MSSPRLVRASAALAFALALSVTAAAAAPPVADPPVRGRPSPAQWQKIFPVLRQQVLQDHRSRVTILQRGERCVTAATTLEALRACQREERSALWQQHQKHRGAVRALLERNGIPMPEERERRGGPGGPGPGGEV
jgi:hypothetical protein